MSSVTSKHRVALTGGVALEVIASYFRDAGYEVMPETETLDAFRPDFVYDVTSRVQVLAEEVEGFYDARMERLAGIPYSRVGMRAIVEEFGWYVRARNAKVLAVDADNTLWRGILSEDGVDALRPFTTLQAGLKRLRDDGVLLVLLSKNDSFDRLKLPVDLSLFAATRVNWEPKAGNLVEVCRALNLGRDAVVFLDDNPHERAQMSSHLPEVAVAPWTGFAEGDSTLAERQLVRRLQEYFFSGFGATAEDRLRADEYARRGAEAVRARSFASHDDYLDDLDLWVKPSKAAEGDLDRLVQMAGKTNQFNATTIRRTREEFLPVLANTFVFRAGDRFGEQGLVAYIVVDPATRRITDFVMSCRAMGRTLEHFALGYVERELGFRPAIDFSPTAKNRPFADFLNSLASGLSTHFKEM